MTEAWLTRRCATREAGRERGKRIREAAPIVLRETKNTAVMWGDCGLLDEIAERADPSLIKLHPMLRHEIVLDALRSCAALVPGIVRVGQTRRVRIFFLPEHAPNAPVWISSQ